MRVRAFSLRVSNTKYLAFDTPKHYYSNLMRCFKCAKILQHTTINAKIFFYLFIHQIFSFIYSLRLSLSLLSHLFSHLRSFLSTFEFFSLVNLAEAANLTADLVEAIVVLHSSLFTLFLFLSRPQADLAANLSFALKEHTNLNFGSHVGMVD